MDGEGNIDDTTIILSLQSDGPEYLDGLLKSMDNEISKRQIIPYIKLFLNETDLFEDNIKKYTRYIIESNDELWTLFSKYLSEDELLNYIKLFSQNNTKMQIDDKFLFYYCLINSDNVYKLFEKNSSNFMLWNLIFKNILESFDITSQNWNLYINKLKVLLKRIFINKKTRTVFIDWIASLINIYIKKIHINVQLYDPTLPSDYHIANILGLLFSFWNEGATVNKIVDIDYDYIISDKCSINWFDKKIVNDTKNYNFLAQCYFLILDSLRVGYIPILSRTLKWEKYIDEIDSEINAATTSNNLFSSFMLSRLYNEKQIIKDYLEIDGNIIKNDLLKNWIHSFYDLIIPWINKQKGKLMDDFLSDMLYFLINIKKEPGNQYTKDIYILTNEIIQTKLFTGSISIKCDFMKLFNEILYDSLCDNFINTDFYLEILTEYSKSLLILHNDLHQAVIRNDYKLFRKLEIYKAFDIMYINKNTHNKELLTSQLVNNKDLTRKFINTYLMDICEINDSVNNLYKKLDNNDNDDNNISPEEIAETKYSIHTVLVYVFKLTKLLKKITILFSSNKHLLEIILSKEILTNLAAIINSGIAILETKIKYDPQLGFDDCEFEKELDIEEFSDNISTILTTIYINDGDLMTIIDGSGFNIQYYKDFINHVDGYLDIIVETLEIKLDEYNNKNNNMITDIPFDLTDPITCTLIENPCLLPGMVGFSEGDIFFDRSTILQQLLVKEINPYTRTPLTQKEFDEFNNTEHIKDKIKKFNDRLQKWKNENKL